MSTDKEPTEATSEAVPAASTPAPEPAVPATQWFDRWFSGWPRPRIFSELSPLSTEGDVLRVEEFTDGDTMVVRVEMPGIDPEHDVEITVVDHQLRIRAERRQETKTETAKGYRSEFHYGSFARSIALPAGCTSNDVKASYVDGVLEVRIPIDRESAAARKVPIERR